MAAGPKAARAKMELVVTVVTGNEGRVCKKRVAGLSAKGRRERERNCYYCLTRARDNRNNLELLQLSARPCGNNKTALKYCT